MLQVSAQKSSFSFAARPQTGVPAKPGEKLGSGEDPSRLAMPMEEMFPQ